MDSSEAELAEERVRRRLAQLGADNASAPAVPAGVTARVVAGLRGALPPLRTSSPGSTGDTPKAVVTRP